jgi:hypothetical protein
LATDPDRDLRGKIPRNSETYKSIKISNLDLNTDFMSILYGNPSPCEPAKDKVRNVNLLHRFIHLPRGVHCFLPGAPGIRFPSAINSARV